MALTPDDVSRIANGKMRINPQPTSAHPLLINVVEMCSADGAAGGYLEIARVDMLRVVWQLRAAQRAGDLRAPIHRIHGEAQREAVQHLEP